MSNFHGILGILLPILVNRNLRTATIYNEDFFTKNKLLGSVNLHTIP